MRGIYKIHPPFPCEACDKVQQYAYITYVTGHQEHIIRLWDYWDMITGQYGTEAGVVKLLYRW